VRSQHQGSCELHVADRLQLRSAGRPPLPGRQHHSTFLPSYCTSFDGSLDKFNSCCRPADPLRCFMRSLVVVWLYSYLEPDTGPYIAYMFMKRFKFLLSASVNCKIAIIETARKHINEVRLQVFSASWCGAAHHVHPVPTPKF
jgi:hypothetical protein